MRESERDFLATVVQRVDGGRDAREAVLVFTVTEGPDRGATFRLDGRASVRALVGTGAACDLRLTDPGISRRHAALEHVGGGVRISDLGSTNGTWVDRVKVIEAELQGGEFVRLGGTMLRVEEEDEARPELTPLTDASSFGRVVGASRAMRRLYPLCDRLAASDVPVVIEGETGTGKEVLAEAIHEAGPRARGPFVVFDCTAVPPNLVEAELFGHERGAFTGAVAARKGVFEQAHGGTLLIDEIGDLDLALQPKLLRAIERAEIRRIGGTGFQRIDLRVLSATRRDLDREVEAGRFRDDLYHRLAIARIELPPLRHRHGDVELLARIFWRAMGGDGAEIPRELLHRWDAYGWPGNVRELRNTVARHVALGDLAGVGRPAPASTRPAAEEPEDLDLPFPQARDRALEAFETRYVARVLERHGGDVAAAAAASGIGRRYFQKLKARTKG